MKKIKLDSKSPNQKPNKVKTQKRTTTLRVILVLFCAVALLSSGIFYYTNGMENKMETVKFKPVSKKDNPKKTAKTVAAEKESVMSELGGMKNTYDEIIIENKIISLELIQERDKVIKLMADLMALKGREFSVEKYRKQVQILQDRLKSLTIENVKLKEENVTIKKQNGVIKEQINITKVVLNESQKNNEGLKRDLANTVEKSSKLSVSGATVIAYKLRTSGELVITDKASKVDGINISFEIAKNEMAKPIDKVYYVQVMDSQNTVLGEINEGTHQYKSLTYSLAINARYEKRALRVSENLLGNKFSKGTYYVSIYDKEELVDEATFMLK